ncbi:MAG: hypothetical protein HYY00_09410 [Chloroflexi bacterium]|nr:hypothetical protein [Chloroflexota bacterium]
MSQDAEALAAKPEPVDPRGLNHRADLPYGCTPDHIFRAMEEFIDFLGFINAQLHSRGLDRLESFLMPANFSSIVGEFMTTTIPKYCPGLVKNRYHNGHPDLIPKGRFSGDAVQHAPEGIEVKGSRYLKGWQGHNPEDIWLMVFVFDTNGPRDKFLGIPPKPFRFLMVVGAKLTKDDWKFAGRSAQSRRTITASITKSGYDKMIANWIYRSSNSS